MPQPSSRLVTKLAAQLFQSPQDRQLFIEQITSSTPSFSPAIIWTKAKPLDSPFEIESPFPWQPQFVDRLTANQRPGNHSLHDQGYYYCLDSSSVFEASVLSIIPNYIKNTNIVFDLCASPGGKAILAAKFLKPRLLICNEVIRKRTAQLIANLKRCAIPNTMVISNDPAVLSKNFPHSADVVIVDAPCTGQSLLIKGKKAPGCFHPININKNSLRQKRIIANAVKLVAPGGFLAYMTCTYSPQENEHIIEWLISRFPEMSPVKLDFIDNYQSSLINSYSYRLFPQLQQGAGGFTTLLRKLGETNTSLLNKNLLFPLFKSENC